MANTPRLILGFLCILNILISLAVAGRDIYADSKNTDIKHPEDFDRSVLIPGVGRVMIPKDRKGFNPFTYNPITGTNSGTGIGIPDIGSVGYGGGNVGNNIAGGDDTSIPFPGVEVPNPESGGNVLVPSAVSP